MRDLPSEAEDFEAWEQDSGPDERMAELALLLAEARGDIGPQHVDVLDHDTVVCPDCDLIFDCDGPDGLIPHAIECHAERPLGRAILRFLEDEDNDE